MPGDQRTELTLNEFINLMSALELGNYIYHNQRISLPGKQYKQLPFDVTVAFKKFNNAVNSEEFKFLDPLTELKNFLSKLTKAARQNYQDSACSECDHAEYLIGFLLDQDFYLKIDDETLSLKALIDNQLPRYYRVFHEGRYDISSTSKFDFQTERWRALQNYPSLQMLSAIWIKYLEKCEQERIAKEQATLQQQQLEEQERRHLEELKAQQALLRAMHTFEGIVLDLEKFSFVIEAFIKTGRIELGNINQHWSTKPKLYKDVSDLICHFAQLVRAKGYVRPSYNDIGHSFVNMMKAVILSAKIEGPQQFASQQLLGFMLYHNFQLQHGHQVFSIADIMRAELTQEDHFNLAHFGPRKLPFLFTQWQKNQCYPGRNDLEKVLVAEQELQRMSQPHRTYSPFYHQHQAALAQGYQRSMGNNPVPTASRLVW